MLILIIAYFASSSGLLLGCETAQSFSADKDYSHWCLPLGFERGS